MVGRVCLPFGAEPASHALATSVCCQLSVLFVIPAPRCLTDWEVRLLGAGSGGRLAGTRPCPLSHLEKLRFHIRSSVSAYSDLEFAVVTASACGVRGSRGTRGGAPSLHGAWWFGHRSGCPPIPMDTSF